MALSCNFHILLASALLSLLTQVTNSKAAAPNIDAIRKASATVGTEENGLRALPLAASWNTGSQNGFVGFDANFQLQRIFNGDYLLPWFPLTRPDELFVHFSFDSAFKKAAELQLPVSFISTQWDVLVAEAIRDDTAGTSNSLLHGKNSEKKTTPLSPFSPINLWYEAGFRWGKHPALEKLQAAYPNPPRILFVSNNEQPRKTWRDIRQNPDELRFVGEHPTDVDIRRAVGDGWIARYRALQNGFRDALTAPEWKRNSVFVGYDAFGTSALGRWPDWTAYSLMIPGRLEPWPLAWEGVSPSYYVPDWNLTSDFQVMSPQIESMNWLPFLEEAFQQNPKLWFELSVWDGQQQTEPTNKAAYYRKLGQQYSPARYQGYLQFGMWLLRPRVVREFRDHLATRNQFSTYFDSLSNAIRMTHEQPVLKRFWQSGRLLANTTGKHPYDVALPDRLRDAQRWYLLDSNLNPVRPWKLDTALRIYALAIEAGAAPTREWLIYAFAPLDKRTNTTVAIPDGPRVVIAASDAGCFVLVHEASLSVETVTC
jgi:hypothetical protein